VEVPLNTGFSAPVQFVDMKVMDDGVLGIASRRQDLVNHFLNELDVVGGAVVESHHRSSTLLTARLGGIDTGNGVGEVLGGVEVWELSNTTIRISRSYRRNISYEITQTPDETESSVGEVIDPETGYSRLTR
jgi:hypothetical protein